MSGQVLLPNVPKTKLPIDDEDGGGSWLFCDGPLAAQEGSSLVPGPTST